MFRVKVFLLSAGTKSSAVSEVLELKDWKVGGPGPRFSA